MTGYEEQMEVTEEEVKGRITDILNRCSESNELASEVYENGYQFSAKEAERHMREIVNVKANFQEVTSSHAFSQCFHKMGEKYNNQMNDAARQYMDGISKNYNSAMQKIRKMLASMGHDSMGVSQRDIYKKWDEGKAQVNRSLKEQVAGLEKGGKEIAEFGDRNVTSVQKIIKKNKKKYRRVKLIPLYIILGLLIVIMAKGIILQQTEETTEETKQQNTMSDAVDKLGGIKKIVEMAGGSLLSFLSGIATTAGYVVFIIAVLWYFLAIAANKWCKARICEEVSTFLLKQVNDFWQQESLVDSMEKSRLEIKENAEEVYRNKFASIFLYPNREEKMNWPVGNEETGKPLPELERKGEM